MTQTDKPSLKKILPEVDTNLYDRALECSKDYLDSVDNRRVYPSEEALDQLVKFEESMPENPGDALEILNQLHTYGSPATVATTGNRYFGFVIGSQFPAAVAAKWLSDSWDQCPGLYVISPIVSHLEEICEKWMTELIGFPSDTAMGLVGGTSTATFCGLAAGRNKLLKQMGWDLHEQGLVGSPKLRIVLGEQAHATVFKALSLLGFGKKNLEIVPTDSQGRIDPNQIPHLDQNTLLILQSGNVNSGAFDPLDVICEKAQKAKAWVHVDGAFGLWAAASENKKHLVKGLELADSWSIDGHKTLNTPYDCGMIFCRDREALVSAMQAGGSYILYGENRDPMLYTPEMSRRSRSVELWATLKTLGRKGVEALVDGLCANAVYFGEQLKNAGFRILNDIVFNQVLVACDAPELTLETNKLIQLEGECWCGGAIWKGEPVIRVSVCSWKTEFSDIDKAVSSFVSSMKRAQNHF